MSRSTRKRGFSFGSFVAGFFTGILLVALAGILLAGYVVKHPEWVWGKAVDVGVNQIVVRTVESIPRQAVAEREAEITASAQKLARAYSENRLSPQDMQALAGRFFQAASDQKITPDEMDALLQAVNRSVR